MPTLPIFSIDCYNSTGIDVKHLEQAYVYTEEDITNDYNPFRIKNIQNYNPIYNRFLTLTEATYNSIQLNHTYHFVNPTTVRDHHTDELLTKPVFIKYSPLLDPIRYMVGKYVSNGDSIYNLPSLNATGMPKLYEPNNAAYVDNFFYFLTSKVLHQYNFVHGIDYYGSYLGIQDKFKMNVADDMEYLITSPFFNEQMNKLFTVCNHDNSSYFADSSRRNRAKLCISNTIHNISAISISDCIETCEPNDAIEETETIYENKQLTEPDKTEHDNSSHSSTSSSDNSNYNDSSDDEGSSKNENDDDETDEDWETETETETERSETTDNDDVQYGYINNFPVQLICIEQCDGTLDDLFVKHKLNEDTAAAALFQVIMTLIVYQKMFHFTHNDLHTNNVMYIETKEPYLYYKYENLTYKVPTYGKIFKLIDFGRSIYTFNGKTMCSDSFAPGGDAATQYNCEPYLDNTKPVIEPNYSFDLCRLGCSIYDFIIPDDEDYENYDELQKTIHRWCLDDRGKNVMYKRNGDERYPQFKLYKMGARTVHNHTPQSQLQRSFFKQFLSISSTNNTKCINIDELPCCA